MVRIYEVSCEMAGSARSQAKARTRNGVGGHDGTGLGVDVLGNVQHAGLVEFVNPFGHLGRVSVGDLVEESLKVAGYCRYGSQYTPSEL